MSIRTKEIVFIDSGTEITGNNGDTITNPSVGVWNFGGATITGAVLVGSEALAQSDFNLWVDPQFIGMSFPFFETPQDALDSILTADYENRFTVNILPGNYDGFIIDNKDFITVKGWGLVHIGTPHNGVSPTGVIKIKDSNNFILDNLILPDTHYNFNPDTETNIIELENSAGKISNIKIVYKTLVKSVDYILRAIKAGVAGGNLIIENSFIDILVDCNATNIDETAAIIEFTDPTDLLKLKIDNLKCRFSQVNWAGVGTTPSTTLISVNSSSTTKYFVFIKNTELEVQYDGDATPTIISGDLAYVGLFNSFSNLGIDITVIGSNNIEDADFIITDENIL